MSSSPSIEPFKGSGTWEECDTFIRAIRAAAWKEGRLWDNTWMAGLAALHFSRKALLWHSQLPEDVRQDWSKLETSILTRWAPPEDEDGARIQPTPAAAPPLNLSANVDRPLQGILRVTLVGSNANYYVEYNHSSELCVLRSDATGALRVRCSPSPNGMLLESLGGSQQSWLAIEWRNGPPNLRDGSTDFSCLPLKASDSPKYPDKPWQLMTCNVSTNDEIIPRWKQDNIKEITLYAFVASRELYLVSDPQPYARKYPREQRARIFIEPIY